MSLFSREELNGRVKRVRSKMVEKRIHCVVLFEWANSYYLSGIPDPFWGWPTVPIIPLEGDAAMIVHVIQKNEAEEYSVIRDLRLYDATRDVTKSVIKLVKGFLRERMLEAKRIGIDLGTITLSMYGNLKSELPNVEFVDISDMMAELRMEKSKEEIELLKKGAEIADIGTEVLVNTVEVGKSELEISSGALWAMEKEIARRFPSWPSYSMVWCQSGLRTLMPLSPSTGKRIKKGEVITVDVLPILGGYWMEEERTLVVGEPSNDQKKAFQAMLGAKEKATEAVRPCVKCSQIARIASALLKEHGYGKYIRHGMGHACGIYTPWGGGEPKLSLVIHNDNVLRVGTIMCVEPGIYLPNIGGFRHSDMVLVTEEGSEFLTKYHRGIITV